MLGSIAVEGVFDFPKDMASEDEYSAGQKVYATVDGIITEIDTNTVYLGKVVADVAVLNKLVGVAKFGIYAGARGSITVSGVFCLVKDPTTNIPAGTILYWSEISHHVIKNQYQHSMIGISVEDAPPSTPNVLVRLIQ